MERTGADEGWEVYQALDGEAPFGASEPTCTARNDLNFRNMEDTGRARRLALSDNRSKDAVSIGRDVVSGPAPVPSARFTVN